MYVCVCVYIYIYIYIYIPHLRYPFISWWTFRLVDKFCSLLHGLEIREGVPLCTFHLKWMSLLPSILTGLWVKKLIEYLILLFALYHGEIIWLVALESLVFESEEWKGRWVFSVCPLLSLSPHGTVGFRATWGLDLDVTWLYLKSIMGMQWELSPTLLNSSRDYFFPLL